MNWQERLIDDITVVAVLWIFFGPRIIVVKRK